MNSNQKATISAIPNGPYIVKNITHFANKNGAIDATETMALCRCGASANKPYCDGSHEGIDFSSASQTPNNANQRDSYAGKNITIHDNRNICAHAGVCTDNLPKVFRMKQEPWIDPDAATAETIISTIDACPSGALSYSINDVEHTPSKTNAGIFIAPNGPFVVAGDVDLVETDWAEGARKNQYTLCRCGASKSKPFCDGSHWSINFVDDDN
ncbi:MAG: CDGSH iron-sulfur domain-containing protein [Gammaproteobacteria bacterium]|nr:CDGSH iron-sulfur domain-containing protein [Gammaproteobacteria bacterium]